MTNHGFGPDCVMRRLLSLLLLICFGMFIPAAGTPLHFCLLEGRIMLPGSAPCSDSGKRDCCGDCSTEHREESCCADAGEIPDGTVPSGPLKFPAPLFVFLELPEFFLSAVPLHAFTESSASFVTPGRNLYRPSERRAVLGIWRI